MDDFEKIKVDWSTSTIPELSPKKVDEGKPLVERLENQRRKVYRANIIASGIGLLTSVYLIYLMQTIEGLGRLFYVSIWAIIALMFVVLILLWKRGLKPHQDFTLDNSAFVNRQLIRLKRSKLILEYSPVYGILLGLLLSVYAYSFIDRVSVYEVFWYCTLTWAYIFLVTFLAYQFKKRKFQKQVQPLIDELEELLFIWSQESSNTKVEDSHSD